MKKTVLIILLIFCSLSVFSKDMKAVYVSTWNPGLFTKAQVDNTIKASKEIGITDLFIQVRRMNDAYYKSNIVPKATNLKENFDMLQYTINQCKKNNIRVHAWFVICRIGREDYKKTLNTAQISWLDKDNKGNLINEKNVFIDPSNEVARKYIVSVISEVINKYPVDGVHLDYIRYPNANFGYCNHSTKQFMLETGALAPIGEPFNNFRREQITKLVQEIRIACNRKSKKIILSASVVSWGAPVSYTKLSSYVTTFQDYEKWLKNNYVDYVMPMIYKRQHVNAQAREYINWLKVYSNHKSKIVPAIGGYLNTSEGIKRQITITEQAGFKNWIVFDFNEGADRKNLLAALK